MEYQYAILVFILLNVIFAHLIAERIGKKRHIGYGKSVFWSILLTPIIGYFITLMSPKYGA